MRHSIRQMKRASRTPGRHAARHWLGALLPVVAIVSLLCASAPARAHASPAALADYTLIASVLAGVFMRALIARDGQLAWHQPCPTLQEQLPAATPATLTTLTNTQRASGSAHSLQNDLQIGVDYLGARVWAAGGQIRDYVVTAHLPSGDDARALSVLRTQASGCVNGILGG